MPYSHIYQIRAGKQKYNIPKDFFSQPASPERLFCSTTFTG